VYTRNAPVRSTNARNVTSASTFATGASGSRNDCPVEPEHEHGEEGGDQTEEPVREDIVHTTPLTEAE